VPHQRITVLAPEPCRALSRLLYACSASPDRARFGGADQTIGIGMYRGNVNGVAVVVERERDALLM
jgi:hypothetical protein